MVVIKGIKKQLSEILNPHSYTSIKKNNTLFREVPSIYSNFKKVVK